MTNIPEHKKVTRTQIAKYCGIGVHAIGVLCKTMSSTFPKPIGKQGRESLYYLDEVQHWIEQRKKKLEGKEVSNNITFLDITRQFILTQEQRNLHQYKRQLARCNKPITQTVHLKDPAMIRQRN